jgi:16S rRNA C1402 (ribose-2'-O) methylase RsmI
MDALQVVRRIGTIAAERARDEEDILLHLGTSVPAFSMRLLDDLDLG